MFVNILRNKASQWAFLAVGGAVFICCFLFKSYSVSQNAQVFVERWVAANYVALQEGNYLEEVAKLERVLTAQIDVAGVTLVDLKAPSAPLTSMGEVDALPKSIWNDVSALPKVYFCGLLKPCVSVRLPGGNLAIGLVTDNKSELGSLLGLTAVIGILVGAGFLITSWEHRRSSRETLAKISETFSTAIKADPASFQWERFGALLGQPLSATFDELREKIERGAVYESTARMTQMLAHDVRKPFSILRMGLGMLGTAKDPASVKKILSRLLPEIDKAVGSVDGLISDVMEVGSTSTELIQEPASPESLIEATLSELFRVYPKSDISVGYDFSHAHTVSVHVQKVGRVFANIVGNAVQAMNYKGSIWFTTRERDGLIEFCIGNAGSMIPAESLPKLFNAFFTSGKKGGTGLGLAIAQKVVTGHGGKIWCQSSKTPEHPEGKVEFFFTLPIAEGHLSKTTASLPKHSLEMTKAFMSIADVSANEASVDKSELSLEEDIVQAAACAGHPLRVLVVDDESVYRSALVSYLSRTPALVAAISVIPVEDAKAALQASTGDAFDLIITDVDMGHNSLDGFELVSEFRKRGLKALVCVHSNRIVPADHKTAFESGAEAFLPKPMARAQLLRVVLQAAKTSKAASVPTIVAVLERQSATAVVNKTPQVLVIDDNVFVLDAWAGVLAADAKVHTMTSLEDLQDRLAKEPGFLDQLVYVVTDMHLDGSAGDGLDVGRLVKSLRTGLPVLLSSDGVFKEAELVGAVDKVIGKDPVGLAFLTC